VATATVVTAPLTGAGVASAAGGEVGTAPAGAGATERHTAVRREEILVRARRWVRAAVPYDRAGERDGYRTDCSGFLSYAWCLDRSYTTRDLGQVSSPIAANHLLPGDGLLWHKQDGDQIGHVVLFAAWRDSARTVAAVWELAPGCARTSRYHYLLDLASIGYVPVRHHELFQPRADHS
jgi:cell wall-associated NlpC family hydrolase